MFLSSGTIGLEIGTTGIVGALVSGSSAKPRVERTANVILPAQTLKPSLREENILDEVRFIDSIKNVCNQLVTTSKSVSLSLPDATSRIMLLDYEGRFKSRSEALDLIKWKLKKTIPLEVNDTLLDFQQLAVKENGDLALMVAIASRSVIGRYEDLLVAAGFSPLHVESHTISLCRLFDKRMSLQETYLFISFYGNTLTVIGFNQGIPEFVRSKDLVGSGLSDQRLYTEINNSLLVYKERFPERDIQAVCSCASPDTARSFQDMVCEATGITPALLEVKSVITPGNNAPGDQKRLFSCSAAIGAAMRNI